MRLPTLLFTALPLLAMAAPAVNYGDSCHHSISKSATTSAAPTTTSTSTSTSSTSSSSSITPATPTPFTVIAAHSGSPIQLQAVNAYNELFFIGVAPTSYCPEPEVEDCPPGTSTTILVNGGGASLDVEVPGGQLMFVQTNGALGFTGPHSASIPAGADTQNFAATPGSGGGLGDFGFTGLGSTGGWLACPAAQGYQVFSPVKGFGNADVPNGNVSSCIGFDALTSSATGPGAWEYT